MEHAKPRGLVLCLTNTVAANFTANVLLAIGAKPAMIEEPSEAAELAAVADALLVNVGTVTSAQAEVMRAALDATSAPWVLDPVACHVLSYRRELVRELLKRTPSLVRGNHEEIDFIRSPASEMAHPACPMLSTGLVDRIWTDGDTPTLEIAGGVPMLQRVTATGCAQGAICAAYLAGGATPMEACESASRLLKRAGERAFARATMPGAFQIALLDELSRLV